VLGFFLDTFEIIFIVVPITAPVLLAFDGVSAIWLGVLFGVSLQTSFLTPPFGFSLFYLRGVAPRSVTTGHIYRGIVPFVAMQMVCIGLVMAIPAAATWLPDVIYRGDGARAEAALPAAADTLDADALVPENESVDDLVPDYASDAAPEDIVPQAAEP